MMLPERRLDPEQIMLAYAPIVRPIAWRLAACRHWVDACDLESAGMFGMWRCACRHELADIGPPRFVTLHRYAFRSMMQVVGRMSPMSAEGYRRRGRVVQVRDGVRSRLGRDGTEDEVAAALGITVGRYRDWCVDERALDMRSLDVPVTGEEGDSPLVDFIADLKASDPEAALEDGEARLEVDRLLGACTDRERDVVRMLYGLDGRHRGMLLCEVGDRLGVSMERIRQLRESAFRKMRRRESCRKTTSV